jgi:hypothetical protein
MENLSRISASLRDVVLRLDRMQADIARLSQQKVPDRFVPVLEATRHLHCGRDWLVAQIKAGVLRRGIDFVERSACDSVRKRYLVNPYSSLRWLNGAQPVTVKVKAESPAIK